QRGGSFSLGVKTSKGVLDVAAAKGKKNGLPATTDDVIRGIGDVNALRGLVADAESGKKTALIPESDVRFGPAVTHPQKILMMGLNYRKHIAEVKAPMPTSPTFFSKFNNALSGHGGTVPLPTKVATKFDYETELVVVVGRRAQDVSSADALSHVFGYATGNDFTARDLQNKTSQWLLGKTPDGFGVLGPWLVTADLVGDPQNLTIETWVNGKQVQGSNTSDMIYSCADLLSYASQHMTLEPGDIIYTGTPEGVIFGKPPEQQVWLKPGDKVVSQIQKTGRLAFDLGVRSAGLAGSGG
ncbi:MAG TPA: fumarylacetoacetate hydrolase family protein, partial [Anaeromyxobacter sp.]|nr:fumarylacetoacetate hydrolase family protein [Anaeromyxobacter sp.]